VPVKSPLNYTGDKFRLLPQILPHLPKRIDTFVDLFSGGGSVFANVNAGRMYVNDNSQQLIDLMIWLYYTKEDVVFDTINTVMQAYSLDKKNREGYLRLRKVYNTSYSPVDLYVLVCHSFNNMFRLNGKGEFNVPFGKRTFNERMQQNLSGFLGAIKRKEVVFYSADFSTIPVYANDVVFVDPPYSNGVAAYNSNWNADDDLRLFRYLSDLDSQGSKFLMTNTLSNNGKRNLLLEQWSNNYHVIGINNDYKGSNHQRKDSGKTEEILVKNYE
jgi:DNA adenine methylase Dam